LPKWQDRCYRASRELCSYYLLKAGMVLSYASNIQRKLSIFFLFSKVQSVN